MFSGCTQSSPGYKNELISSSWSANLTGGAQLSLDFEEADGDLYANLSITNASKKAEISGQCLLDEESFVIFDSSVCQNYAFDFVPKGKTLELSYNGKSITLQKNDKTT